MKNQELPDQKLHDLSKRFGLAWKSLEEVYAELYAYIELERCKNCPLNKEISDDESRNNI